MTFGFTLIHKLKILNASYVQKGFYIARRYDIIHHDWRQLWVNCDVFSLVQVLGLPKNKRDRFNINELTVDKYRTKLSNLINSAERHRVFIFSLNVTQFLIVRPNIITFADFLIVTEFIFKATLKPDFVPYIMSCNFLRLAFNN